MNTILSPRARWPFRRCAILIVALAIAALARDKRPMTFMDVMEMRSVGAGSIPPDGKYVLYTLSTLQWKAGKRFTDVFVAATDGSTPPRQMTFTKEKNETQPHWARDSRTLGFLADREGPNQLYLMRIDGGEARKLSDAKDRVDAFAFSRDGKWVAFSPGKPEERQIWLASLEKEDAPIRLTKHATPVGAWAWSPDSTRIFFLAPDRAPAHLWSVSLADQSEKCWTSGNDYGFRCFLCGVSQRLDGPPRQSARSDGIGDLHPEPSHRRGAPHHEQQGSRGHAGVFPR
jgi:dipeptidyl aminopeptidase/acylaminoacyl peptidase